MLRKYADSRSGTLREKSFESPRISHNHMLQDSGKNSSGQQLGPETSNSGERL